jgi:hypothetical protein
MSGRYLASIAQTGDIDYKPIETFLNREDVRAAIHARRGGTFELSSDAIYKHYARGVMRDYSGAVASCSTGACP